MLIIIRHSDPPDAGWVVEYIINICTLYTPADIIMHSDVRADENYYSNEIQPALSRRARAPALNFTRS
jgi:hypothetical protein